MNHVLVVDDEAEIRSSLEEILKEEGYGVATAATAAEALVLLQDAPYDVVLLDIWLPDRDGLDVLTDIHALAPEMRPEVVIISGHGTIETAVKATKLGAYDFLEKPLSIERTLIVLKNAVDARRLRTQNEEFKRQQVLRLEAIRHRVAPPAFAEITDPERLLAATVAPRGATAPLEAPPTDLEGEPPPSAERPTGGATARLRAGESLARATGAGVVIRRAKRA